jgi:hypothetical protein
VSPDQRIAVVAIGVAIIIGLLSLPGGILSTLQLRDRLGFRSHHALVTLLTWCVLLSVVAFGMYEATAWISLPPSPVEQHRSVDISPQQGQVSSPVPPASVTSAPPAPLAVTPPPPLEVLTCRPTGDEFASSICSEMGPYIDDFTRCFQISVDDHVIVDVHASPRPMQLDVSEKRFEVTFLTSIVRSGTKEDKDQFHLPSVTTAALARKLFVDHILTLCSR